jgi:FkbM family methyltransferase
MGNYFRTLASFSKNHYVNWWGAAWRHTLWQVRKILNFFPCDIPVGKFTVRVADRKVANGVGATVNASGYFDPNNMHFLEDVFRHELCTNFYDVGANIGVYSLLVASSSIEARICAFEPHPDTFSFLLANVSLNKFGGRIRCFQAALGEEEGQIDFTDEPGSPVNKVLTEARENSALEKIRVAIRRGDAIHKETGMSPEVLKIDVEGFEDHVLRGFSASFSTVKMILVECQDVSETAKILCSEYGFAGPFKMDYKNRRLVRDDFSYEDWLFLSEGFLATLSDCGFECGLTPHAWQGRD